MSAVSEASTVVRHAEQLAASGHPERAVQVLGRLDASTWRDEERALVVAAVDAVCAGLPDAHKKGCAVP